MSTKSLLGTALILVTLLGSELAYSQTPNYGEWVNSDGSRVSMECPSEYKDITRLPFGCVNMLDGGGVVWTPEAYSHNEGDLRRASVLIAELTLNISDLRAQILKITKEHSDKLSSLEKDALKDIEDIKSAHKKSMLSAFSYGIASGVILSLIVGLSI